MASSATTETNDKQKLFNLTQLLDKIDLDKAVPSGLIDTASALSKVLDTLEDLPTQPPSFYFDLEGENLSRNGTVSILQLYVLPTRRVYLIDIYTLRNETFTCQGSSGRTLKDILESQDIPKIFFDVRNDSDALYSHFKIHLAGIQDLQLMELATRRFNRRRINGLAKCIEFDCQLSLKEKNDWKFCKDKGVRLFAPEHGGSYKVFNERPLSEDIQHYCIQDVHFLPRLWVRYDAKLTPAWRRRVELSSTERVAQSQSATYLPHGQHKALAPAGWATLK